ncbi:MAG: hypothetical protein J0H15_11105 [Xanthomonadales bacterium]|nr:hypothetical protein [Xanthomonadales bacterium]
MLAAALLPAAMASPPRLTGQVIANGGSSASASFATATLDYRLSGTIGEPVAGLASAGPLQLHGGFWQPAAPRDDIFHNGFEG